MENANHNSVQYWLALIIGNTRLHWGYFYQETCLSSWHTPHLDAAALAQLQQARFVGAGWQALDIWPSSRAQPHPKVFPRRELSVSDIWIASAVPQQSELWADATKSQRSFPQDAFPHSPRFVEHSQIPLANIYPTLGIDRAINLLGAGQLTGWPTVVIDAGTAITLTAGVEQGKAQTKAIYGGAILPGLRLQSEALAQKTGALSPFVPDWQQSDWPAANGETVTLPIRWAMDSAGAIASGLIYSVTATLTDYLQDWWQIFPDATAILTGGDAPYLYQCLKQRTPEMASRVLLNSELMFYGMSAYRTANLMQ